MAFEQIDLALLPLTDEEEYLCPLCGGTGVVIYRLPAVLKTKDMTRQEYELYRLPFGDIGKQGDYINRMERCPCRTKAVTYRHLRSANVPMAFVDAALENARTNQKGIAAQLRNYATFVLSGVNGPGVFPILGPSALGKTYLAVACLKSIIENGGTGDFMAFDAFLDGLSQRAVSSVETKVWLRGLKGGRRHVFVLDGLTPDMVGLGDADIVERFAEFLNSYEYGGNLIFTTYYGNIESVLSGILGRNGVRVAARLAHHLYGETVHRLTRESKVRKAEASNLCRLSTQRRIKQWR